MALAGGNQLNQVHLEVRVKLVAHVRLGLWHESILCVASIHRNGRVDDADNVVSVAGDILHTSDEIRVVLGCKQMLDIRSISKLCNAVHVWTSNVLPLKPVPEVDCSHDICVECVHKLADAVVKEPVNNGTYISFWSSPPTQLHACATCSCSKVCLLCCAVILFSGPING